MEEQLTPYLNHILQNTAPNNSNTLDVYYRLFDEKKYIEKNFESIYDDIKEHYNLLLQSLRYGHNCTGEQEIYKKLVFAVISEIDIKKRIKLIPLIIYLDNNRILYDYLVKINYFNTFVIEIKDFFIGTLNDSGINIKNIDKLSDYDSEKEWYIRYEEGIKDLNFQKIYSFVEGYERGRGFRFDNYTDFLIFISYKYLFEDLVEIANNKKDMFEIIFMINILSVEESLTLAKQSNNKLLKFEVIRKAVYFKSNNYTCLNLLKNEKKLIKELIIELSEDLQLWMEFLKFYLEYPSRSVQLFPILSSVLSEINISKIDIFIEYMKINQYIDNDSKEALNSAILKIKDDEKQKYILKNIFFKWNKFIDTYDEYFTSIILTDVIDIAIVYIRDIEEKEIIVKELDVLLFNISEINNKWFKDKSEQRNYFYKQMSKLFIYGFSIEKYDLIGYKDKIKYIIEYNAELKNDNLVDNKNTYMFFDEYILNSTNKRTSDV